jgi:Uma2 family endonuclease
VHGEVWAMAGASVVHATITMNLAMVLTPAARTKGCHAYASDMKFQVSDAVFDYPDLMIVCGDSANPYFYDTVCVVIEIISPGTARIDQNEKRYAYTAHEAVRLYLLIDSRKQAVTGYYRTKQGWHECVFQEDDRVPVPCADIALSFEDIYQQTALAPSAQGCVGRQLSLNRPLAKVQPDDDGYRPKDCSVDTFARRLMTQIS